MDINRISTDRSTKLSLYTRRKSEYWWSPETCRHSMYSLVCCARYLSIINHCSGISLKGVSRGDQDNTRNKWLWLISLTALLSIIMWHWKLNANKKDCFLWRRLWKKCIPLVIAMVTQVHIKSEPSQKQGRFLLPYVTCIGWTDRKKPLF